MNVMNDKVGSAELYIHVYDRMCGSFRARAPGMYTLYAYDFGQPYW